ncbi:MAG: hypothetical protein U0T74_06370 [Chitinophagales bacterium]
MKVYCTPQFIKQIEKLQRNNSYSAVLEDVCSFLSDKNIEELHLMVDLLQKAPNFYSLNKYRITNGVSNQGKSGSYRCICVCLPKQDGIYLGYIYPKAGSQGKENLTKEEFKAIAVSVDKAIKADDLYELNIAEKKYSKKR